MRDRHTGEMVSYNLFRTADGRPRRLRGTAIYSGSARMAELAGRCGFDVTWIDLEHGSSDLAVAEALCVASESGGAAPLLRIPDAQRCHVLRGAEAGPRILVVPMIESAHEAARVVEYAKFPPVGKRGFNLRSRGLSFGLSPAAQTFAGVNKNLCVMVQIESRTAVEALDEILAVNGLDGVFIGPGDLSVSYGCTAQFDNPELVAVVRDVTRRAKAAGKLAGILAAPSPVLTAALEAGTDLVICGGDIPGAIDHWRGLLAKVPAE